MARIRVSRDRSGKSDFELLVADLVLMNHHDPVMAAHQVGGDGGRVAIAGATARGVPGFKGDTVTSPAEFLTTANGVT